MRWNTTGMLLSTLALATVCAAGWSQEAGHEEGAPVPKNANRLSRREQAQGWKLLFDGKSTDGWRKVACR